MNSGEIDFNYILNRSYGGSLGETLTNAFYVENSGYVLSGMHNSAQGTDYFVLLIDFNGTKVWEKTFVGNLSDRCTSSVLTQDGNIVLAGYSNSNSGGTKSSNRKSSYDFDDFWIIKIDLNGNLLWEKTYGSNGDDECYSIVEADNGDFLLAGISFGSGFDKSSTSFGNYDYWLMRLDSSGTKIWDKSYGGSGEDECYDLVKLPNDFYMLVGESHSEISGNKTSARIGGSDFWVVKVNGNGTKVWDNVYGSISDDYGKTIAVNEAGDIYLGGYSGLGNYGNPSDDRTEKSNGDWDFWVIKTNSNGEIKWEKTIGGTGDDRCYDILCLDNNVVLAAGGTSSPRDGNITLDGYGDYDALAFYLSESGEIIDQERFGTESYDVFSSASKISNGGVIYAGTFGGDFKIVTEQKQVYAVDPKNGLLNWSLSKLPLNGIVEINGQGSFPSQFTYKPNNGFWGDDNFTISVSNGISHAEYSFKVFVSFQNTPPVDLNATDFLSILENQPTGTVVGEFNATDPDGDTITYHLVSGEGDGNNSLFTLDQNGTLKTAAVLDYEAGSSLNIRVQAKDEYNATTEGNFTVSLLDVYEDLDGDQIEDHLDDDIDGDGYTNEEEAAYPSNPRNPNSVANATPENLDFLAPLQVSENKKPGVPVGKLTSTGPGAQTFELVEGDGDDHNNLFILHSSGLISSAESFDYEGGVSQFLIRAKVIHESNETAEQIFSVHLLDDPYENNPYGSEQAEGTALAGESNSSDYDQFGMIDPFAGWIDSDDNTSGQYTGFLGSSDVNMTIDDGLRIYTALTVKENEQPGTLVGKFQAHDRDEWAVLTYSLVEGEGSDHNGLFDLDTNGTLRTITTFDYETNASEYAVRVRAIDERNTYVDKVFTVYLLDIDDTKPVITLNGPDVYYHPYRTNFTDPGAQAYDLVDGNLTDQITITGEVNPFELSEFEMIYRVTDGMGNEADPAIRKVVIDDSSFDRTPKKLHTVAWLGVMENQPVGTIVSEFNATDPDEGGITYSLVSGTGGGGNSYFYMDQAGVLFTNAVFDYEEHPEYSIRVRAEVITGHFVEEIFKVSIFDQVAPIVETEIPKDGENGNIWVGGKIIDDLGADSWETGLLISFDQPFYEWQTEGIFDLKQAAGVLEFGFEFFPGEDTKKVYVMAYAGNEEGTHYGLLEEYDNRNRGQHDKRNLADLWASGRPVEGYPGWWQSWWLGTYFKADNGWWYHGDLGWIYPSGGAGGGMWLWKDGLELGMDKGVRLSVFIFERSRVLVLFLRGTGPKTHAL